MAAQYIQGDTNPVEAVVATGKAVTTGDIVGISSNTLVKASDTTWNTNLATTQADFAALFLGVSGQTKTATQARPYGNSLDNFIRVDTEGTFEFDADAATYNQGEYIAPAKHPSNNALLDDKVAKVAARGSAIGVVARTTGANAVKVRVRLWSHVVPAADDRDIY